MRGLHALQISVEEEGQRPADVIFPERAEARKFVTCMPVPIGCGQQVNPRIDFRDELSLREYGISHLCQTCQDSIFGGE